MAKGARTYSRDARGRFASTSGGKAKGGGRSAKPRVLGGSLPARAKLRGAQARQAEAPSPQRKGAVTRAQKGLAAARKPVQLARAALPGRMQKGRRAPTPVDQQGGSAQVQDIKRSLQRIAARDLERQARPGQMGQLARESAGLRSGMSRGGRRATTADGVKAIRRRLSRAELMASRGSKPAAKAAETYRRQLKVAGQGLAKPKGVIRKPKPSKPSARARNGIRSLPSSVRAPKNGVRAYQPATDVGMVGRAKRILQRVGREARREMGSALNSARKVRAKGQEVFRRWAMRTARDIGRSKGKGIEADVARSVLSQAPAEERRNANRIIADRAARAAAAAARGSKPAARAREIYATQLAGMGPGKPPRGKNAIKPGPRNTKGTPRKRRKPRKPKG